MKDKLSRRISKASDAGCAWYIYTNYRPKKIYELPLDASSTEKLLQNKTFMTIEASPAARKSSAVVPKLGVMLGGIDVEGYKRVVIAIIPSDEEMADWVTATRMNVAADGR
jgi:hypothetical protein